MSTNAKNMEKAGREGWDICLDMPIFVQFFAQLLQKFHKLPS